MCLNESVIAGKCAGCVAYRVELKTAREQLEAVEGLTTHWRGQPSKDDEWWIETLKSILHKGGE